MTIYVLRLGHRPLRDKRITTHVGLTARAFGASGFIIADVKDEKIVMKVKDVIRRWGGKEFIVDHGVPSIEYIKKWKLGGGLAIHLTMYGLHIDQVINEIRESGKKLLVIVGASKVPGIVYELADYNVAVGNQPHSEVAALAIFLDRFFKGKELHFISSDAKICIVPSAREKKVIKCEEGKQLK